MWNHFIKLKFFRVEFFKAKQQYVHLLVSNSPVDILRFNHIKCADYCKEKIRLILQTISQSKETKEVCEGLLNFVLINYNFYYTPFI